MGTCSCQKKKFKTRGSAKHKEKSQKPKSCAIHYNFKYMNFVRFLDIPQETWTHSGLLASKVEEIVCTFGFLVMCRW